MKTSIMKVTTLFVSCLLLTSLAYSDTSTFFLGGAQSEYADVLIERVIQADRIVLSTGEKVRLIGIRAPEAPPKERVERNEFGFVIEPMVTPETQIEESALQFAKELMENKHVRLEFDTQKKGESYETLAYVFLADGRMANVEILKQGLAHLQLRAPNLKYEDMLRQAYREARQEKRGLQAE